VECTHYCKDVKYKFRILCINNLLFFKIISVPPAIDSSDLNLNPKVNKGHSSVLFCPVEGNPAPDILWLKVSYYTLKPAIVTIRHTLHCSYFICAKYQFP
jgi:hypothetical protein